MRNLLLSQWIGEKLQSTLRGKKLNGEERYLECLITLHCFNKLYCFLAQLVNVIISTFLNYESTADVHSMSPANLRLDNLSQH